MTKEEIHQNINKTFFKHVEELYPDYFLEKGKDKSHLVFPDGSMDNSIEYDMEKHTVSAREWCTEQTQMDLECLEEFLKKEVEKYPELK